jgi:signal transduction histidine kinase
MSISSSPRTSDRQQLVKGACECLVQSRGYHAAWLALCDDAGHLRTAAHAGASIDLERVDALLAGGDPPACIQAVLEQPPGTVYTNEAGLCADSPLLDAAGCCGALATRLAAAGQTFGVLVVSTPPAVQSDPEEQALFAEVASDIAVALHGLTHAAQAAATRRELAATESVLASVLNSSVDAIIALAAERASDGELKWTTLLGNEAAARVLGTPIRAGQAIAALMPDWTSTALASMCTSVHVDGGHRERDLELSRVAAPGWYRVTVAPLREGVTLTLRDISARVDAQAEKESLEAQLRRSQKLEAVGQLAGGVAHDFNNILTAVLGNVELLRMQFGANGAVDEGALSHLQQIERAAQRAASLTRQMLAFSRRQAIRREILDLNHIMADVEKMFAASDHGEHQPGAGTGAGRDADHGRCGPTRTGHHEPGHQRAGRDAQWRAPGAGDARRYIG